MSSINVTTRDRNGWESSCPLPPEHAHTPAIGEYISKRLPPAGEIWAYDAATGMLIMGLTSTGAPLLSVPREGLAYLANGCAVYYPQAKITIIDERRTRIPVRGWGGTCLVSLDGEIIGWALT